jgi:hypothetical protein
LKLGMHFAEESIIWQISLASSFENDSRSRVGDDLRSTGVGQLMIIPCMTTCFVLTPTNPKEERPTKTGSTRAPKTPPKALLNLH